jgi:PKD repeat protein
MEESIVEKKPWVLILSLLLITSSLSFFSATPHAPANARADTTVETDCGCGTVDSSVHHPLKNQITIDDTATQSGQPLARSDLASYFSWRDRNGTDWTTPAQDQGNCGSCWDFAAIGALESVIQIRENSPGLRLDLSEQYVLSCLHMAGSCNGGWAYNAYKYIKSNTSQGNYCNGIIPEFCFPYQVNDKVPCANVSSNWKDFLIPLSAYGFWKPANTTEGRNQIKTKIMDDGPVTAIMLCTYYPHGPNNLEDWGYQHHSPTEYYAYPGPVTTTNHQVVLVGWKNDATIPHGGYWIVKNSFGPDWGYDGFFNIEYGSLKIDTTDIDWVDYNPANFSNWPPVARANGPYYNTTIFDGSTSFDHEGTITTYRWDFGDGTTATDPIATHVYTNPGIYHITLTVTDNDNNTGTDSTWAYIATTNHPPQPPVIKGRHRVQANTTYDYTLTATDPDGNDVTIYLNWGDTYWDGGAIGWLGPYHSGQTVTLQKNWTEKANYTIRAKAMDPYGAKSDWATLHVTLDASTPFPIPRFWDQLFQRFPHAFLLLRHFMGY